MVDVGPVGPVDPQAGRTSGSTTHARIAARRREVDEAQRSAEEASHVLLGMLRTLPSSMRGRAALPEYRPTDGSAAISPEAGAMMDQDNARDIAKFDRFPDVQDALRALRAQILHVTGVPPVHMDAGLLQKPGAPSVEIVPEPYATDRQGNVWRLDADERAYSPTSELRPPIAVVREDVEREIARREAERVAEREATIRDQLAGAHERATGRRLAAHQREEAGKAWRDAAAAEQGQRRAYTDALALPALHTRSRAYAARTAAVAAPAGTLLYVAAVAAGSVLLVILAAIVTTLAICAAVRAASEHRTLGRLDAQRIEPARLTYDGACARLASAEIAYVLAGGDPWIPSSVDERTDEVERAVPAPARSRTRRRPRL